MTYLGHVAGERARQVWGAADAFVLPSFSEGFSIAVLEALACRLPCLITTACHFPELAAAGGCIEVTPDVDAVSQGLRDLLERTPAERASIGQIGRRLVEEQYTWDRQAERLASVYEWLSGRRTGPRARHLVAAGRDPDFPAVSPSDAQPMRTDHAISDLAHEACSQSTCDKMPVSVIIPVKNEAENLKRCLPALAWADEVFVVDSQSSDQTAEVAASFGAEVVQFHFNGTYPKKKNWALDNLPFRNEWVMIVDADEVVVPELANEIADRIARDRSRRILPQLTLLLPGPAHPPLRVFIVLEPAIVQASTGPLRENSRWHRGPRRRQ